MNNDFPRTIVGGVSLPRLIIGSNWFLGYSHTSLAKDRFIRELQTRQRITEVLVAFVERGVDAVMGPPSLLLEDAVVDAEQHTGRKITRILTPIFALGPDSPPDEAPELMIDRMKALNATFCMPHQAVTDALVDRRAKVIRDIDVYTKMIRERDMIPGLSTHMPEAVIYADNTGADVETYIQIYNGAGFLMQVEADWVNRVIRNANKPVMTIKPLAAGKLLPLVGLGFVWSTIREQDMVTIGCTTADEAREVVDISLDLLEQRIPENELQRTRSKLSLTA